MKKQRNKPTPPGVPFWDLDDAILLVLFFTKKCTLQEISRGLGRSEPSLRESLEAWLMKGENPRGDSSAWWRSQFRNPKRLAYWKKQFEKTVKACVRERTK